MRPEELFNLIKKTKFENVGDDVDFAVLVFPEENSVRLIFEESASKRDWQNNFNFPIKPYKNQQNTLWFARGWAKAYKSANDLIMEKVSNTEKLAGLVLKVSKYIGVCFLVMLIIDIISFIIFMLVK